jgi:hypothetical protein
MTRSTTTKVARSAAPLTRQHAHEVQAFGSVVPMPVALAEGTRRASADNSRVIRTNGMRVWFVAEHLVDGPLVHADGQTTN